MEIKRVGDCFIFITPNYHVSFSIAGDSTNCKLSYIHGIGSLNVITNEEEKKEVLTHMLRYCKGCVIINTTNKNVAKYISENYPVYYFNNVPIGYNGGFQYHICIKNTININGHCRNPEDNLSLISDKKIIKNKLLSTLKKFRRKTDYVDNFITELYK